MASKQEYCHALMRVPTLLSRQTVASLARCAGSRRMYTLQYRVKQLHFSGLYGEGKCLSSNVMFIEDCIRPGLCCVERVFVLCYLRRAVASHPVFCAEVNVHTFPAR